VLPSSRSRAPRRLVPIVALAVVALALSAPQLLPSADAGDMVLTQVAGRARSVSFDAPGGARSKVAALGAGARSLVVGETPHDGSDTRVLLPFKVSAEALDALHDGGRANVSMRVWRVVHLEGQQLAVDAYTNGTMQNAAYARPAKRLVSTVPVRGRLAVDVTGIVRPMTRPGTLVVRVALGHRAPMDGVRTQVDIATSASRNAANRPVLSVGLVGSPGPVTVPSIVTAPPAPTVPTTRTAPTTTTTAPAPPATNEIFRDDFNGATLDRSKWRPNWLAGTDDAVTKPVNSNEQSCYDPAQVSVGGGYLHLNAVSRACRANNGVTYPYASGLIESAGHFTFTYGTIEARIWVPPGTAGVANWPAFWANGTGTWPITGELDVMEGLEGHTCFHFHSTLGGPGGCAPLASPSGWHTYAADWEPGSVTYFYDGVQVGRVTSGITASPMYLILNLAVSPSISPPVQLPSEMLVDWVRVTR
jgi:beta-glucanase (GH16 family)